VLGGILLGLAAVFLAPTTLLRAGLVFAGSLLAGLAAIAIVQGWLGVVEGPWLLNAAVLSLIVLAIAIVVAGFEALLGTVGIALAALAMILIGNPFSGVSTAPEMLPQPVGAIGQLMPPGAGGNLLRSTAFFDGAGAGGHLAVLVAWAVLGSAALMAAARKRPLASQPARPVTV
jgi:hypothetical protein